jgi:hypothetical protein
MNITKFTFVYPAGYADPERLAADPHYQPGKFGPVEEYDLKQANTAPQVGDQVDGWIVAQVDRYLPQNTEIQFCTAICTADGSIPQRQDWQDSAPKILRFYLDGDQLALNDEGYAEFEVSDRPGQGAGASSFKPAQGRPVAGYDLVMAYQAAPTLVAA